MLDKIYYHLYRLTSKSKRGGNYSGGHWADKVRQETLELCRRFSGRILEVGCGEGLFLAELAVQSPGLEIWGVDKSEVRLKEAGERFSEKNLKNINLRLQDATDLHFEDGYFDAVVCINVFFNMPSIEEIKQSLAQIRRICKKSGIIIFDIRNRANVLLALKYLLAPFYDNTIKNLPLKTYGFNQIKDILKDSGFSIIKERFIGLPLNRFASIIIIEAKKNAD